MGTQANAPKRKATPESKPARNQDRKAPAEKQKPQPQTKTAAAVSGQNTITKKVEKVRDQMRDMGVGGCYGCLIFDHQWAEGFRYCPNVCPFCKMEFRQGDRRHFAIECRKCPRTRAEIVDIMQSFKERMSRRR